MPVLRRVIWMNDKEWQDIALWAADMGLTPSAYIRHAVAGLVAPEQRPESKPIVEEGRIVGYSGGPDQIDVAIATVNRKMTQAERDAILRRVNKGG